MPRRLAYAAALSVHENRVDALVELAGRLRIPLTRQQLGGDQLVATARELLSAAYEQYDDRELLEDAVERCLGAELSVQGLTYFELVLGVAASTPASEFVYRSHAGPQDGGLEASEPWWRPVGEADTVPAWRPLGEHRFDPSRPVSVSNMPPWDELEFEPLPKSYRRAVLVRLKPEPARRYGRQHHREIAVYKVLPAGELRNEVTAWLVARLLGLNNVPETRQWIGPFGEGMLQEYVDGRPARLHPRGLQSQQLAVLDYVLAQRDRKPANELGPWAIDNERSLPEPGSRYLDIRSSRVRANFGRELDSELVERLRAVDAGRLRDLLLSLGHSASSAGWAVRRLQEIQQSGRITGQAWNRPFGRATTGLAWYRRFWRAIAVDSKHLAAYRPRWIEVDCLIGVLEQFAAAVSGNREVRVTVPDIVDVDAVDLSVAQEAIDGPRGTRPVFREHAEGATVHKRLEDWAQTLEGQRRWRGNGVLAIVAKPGRTEHEPGHTVLWRVAISFGEARVLQWDPQDPEDKWTPWQPASDRGRRGAWQAAFFGADGTPVLVPLTDTRDPDATPLSMQMVAQSSPPDQLSEELARVRQRVADSGESGFFVLAELANRDGLDQHVRSWREAGQSRQG